MQSNKTKTWRITVERIGGTTDDYFIEADTLYEAFIAFSDAYFPWNLVGLHITEASA